MVSFFEFENNQRTNLIIQIIINILNKFKEIYIKILYWYISVADKNAEITFMNFGYSKNNQKIKLD